jgi:putative oxidoreductase
MIANLVVRAQERVLSARTTLAPLAPLVARVTVGLVFLSSGWGKLHNLEKVTAFFTDLGIPAPQLQAPFVSAVELVGGALVLLGVGSRVASLLLASTMVVALATAKRADVMGATDLFGLVEWTYLVLLGWLALSGPGSLSVDGIRAHFGRRLPTRLAAATV